MGPEISIIILTKNGQENIGTCLKMVFNQQGTGPYEVVLIDSGSLDATLEIAKSYPVKIIQIAPEKFSHSSTRNLGVSVSSGEYVVFLTQDATAANNLWLNNLVQPLRNNPGIAGVYSRQIPRDNCYPSEARDIRAGSGLEPKLKAVDSLDAGQKQDFERNIWKYSTFSNISAAYPKHLLQKYPFNQDLPAAEDQEWAMRMLKNGFSIYYEPGSCVYHSHNHTWKSLFRKYKLFGRCFKKFIPDRSRATFYYFLKICAYETFKDYIFLFNYTQGSLKKAAWSFKIPLYRIIKNYAFYTGFKNG